MLNIIHILYLSVGLWIIFGVGDAGSLYRTPKLEIIGGQEAIPHSAPYMVRVVLDKFNKSSGQYHQSECSGTLLFQEYVLTSKHCLIDILGAHLEFGKHNVSQFEAGEVYQYSTNYILHPSIDIALIKVDTPVNHTANISDVTLPARKDVGKNYTGSVGVAYGWGSQGGKHPEGSPVLMTLDSDIISNNQCDQDLKRFNKTAHSHEFCTGGMKGGKVVGTCLGDSGGPVLVDGIQIGITARGPKCELGGPSINVNVSMYLDWIEQSTGVIIN